MSSMPRSRGRASQPVRRSEGRRRGRSSQPRSSQQPREDPISAQGFHARLRETARNVWGIGCAGAAISAAAEGSRGLWRGRGAAPYYPAVRIRVAASGMARAPLHPAQKALDRVRRTQSMASTIAARGRRARRRIRCTGGGAVVRTHQRIDLRENNDLHSHSRLSPQIRSRVTARWNVRRSARPNTHANERFSQTSRVARARRCRER